MSILIPFATNNRYRRKVFKWVLKYWKHELPNAEIIVGRSKSIPFCKNEALNDAFRRSTGKVIVMMDADAYIDGSIIEDCADKILENLDNHLWFVPYRRLYRLNKETTEKVINSDPNDPFIFDCPPTLDEIEDDSESRSGYGHRYGAMCQIYPREAIETLGCYDERFTGWGGEDVSILRALDTLYGKHKTTNNCIYHLWHPFLGKSYDEKQWEQTRKWDGQERANNNERLTNRYNRATNKPIQMRILVDEGCRYSNNNCIDWLKLIWKFICLFSDQNIERLIKKHFLETLKK